jgi:AraC-like DNA-binding protein
LDRLQIQGAIFLHARYTEAWAYTSAPTEDLASLLAPHARTIVPFHVVAAGRCWIDVDGVRYWAEAGDVIVLPYGSPHAMGGTEEAELVAAITLVPAPPWTTMPLIEHGTGGERTHVLCGYITCDDPLFDPALRALPPAIVVTPTGPAAQWVRASLDYAVAQTTEVRPSEFQTPAKFVELLLVEVLKLHLAGAPPSEIGFIAALRDPVLAPALAAIHAAPGTKWTVGDLAATAHVSESVLDERFRGVLGLPPIRYLTGWRMHLAQDLLNGTDLSVLAVSRRVGYESEEAFSRAFKRKHGVAPSVWRRNAG